MLARSSILSFISCLYFCKEARCEAEDGDYQRCEVPRAAPHHAETAERRDAACMLVFHYAVMRASRAAMMRAADITRDAQRKKDYCQH